MTRLPVLEYVDVLTFDEKTGTVTGWACALIDAKFLDVSERRECAAPRGECARGMTTSFQCLTPENR